MEKPKLRVEQINREDRPLKGLIDKGIVHFRCDNCDIDLLCLQLTSVKGHTGAEVITQVAVECGICGSYSGLQVTGKFSPGAPNDNMIFDVIDGDSAKFEADVFFKAWKK